MKDESQLIDETLAGQSGAFGQLVERYQDRLFNSLVHLLGSADDARDIAQDAFVQAFVKLETFRGKSSFYTWLYRIAFNLAVSQKRRHKPTISIEQAREKSGDDPVDASPGPDSYLDQQDRAVRVRQALAALNEEHRQILVLREMEDCSYEEIAEILDVPVGTVRSRLHRARIQLRDELERVMQEELG